MASSSMASSSTGLRKALTEGKNELLRKTAMCAALECMMDVCMGEQVVKEALRLLDEVIQAFPQMKEWVASYRQMIIVPALRVKWSEDMTWITENKEVPLPPEFLANYLKVDCMLKPLEPLDPLQGGAPVTPKPASPIRPPAWSDCADTSPADEPGVQRSTALTPLPLGPTENDMVTPAAQDVPMAHLSTEEPQNA